MNNITLKQVYDALTRKISKVYPQKEIYGSSVHQNLDEGDFNVIPISATITGQMGDRVQIKALFDCLYYSEDYENLLDISEGLPLAVKAMLRNAEAAGINTVGLTTKTAATVNLTTATGAAVGAEAAMQIATAKNTVAQAGFNTTLLACPLTWIVGAIIIVIALFTRWSQKTNEAKGVTVSFFGTLVGNLNIARVWFQNFVTNTKLQVLNRLQQDI